MPRQSAIGPEFRHDAAIYGATYHHDSPCARHRAPERAGPVYSARHWPRSPEARRAKPLLRLSVVRRSPAPVSYLAGTAFAKRRSNEPSLFGTHMPRTQAGLQQIAAFVQTCQRPPPLSASPGSSASNVSDLHAVPDVSRVRHGVAEQPARDHKLRAGPPLRSRAPFNETPRGTRWRRRIRSMILSRP